jgi:glycosyltransferase involved in cell wall biosynthesis
VAHRLNSASQPTTTWCSDPGSEMAKIIFLVAHPVEDASRRYRVQQFIPLLEQAGHECTVSEFSTPQLFRALHSRGQFTTKVLHTVYCSARRLVRLADLSEFDLIIIHREVFPFLTPMLEKWVLKRHPNVMFSLDDATYAAHPDTAQMRHPLLYRFKYGRDLSEIMRQSAHVIVGNSTLANYAKEFSREVSVFPTVVDCEKYTYKPVATPSAQALTIGWMGSNSTAAYLSEIVTPLKQLAKNYPRKVQFRFLGCKELNPDLPRASVSSFRLETELDDLRSLDIGLMPMPDTAWTRGKCAFKAIQYMAMGIPTVASPVGSTLDLIQHNSNGLLAQSERDWYDALELLVTDYAARQRLSTRGRETILKSYSLQVWAPRLISLIDQLTASCPREVSLSAAIG